MVFRCLCCGRFFFVLCCCRFFFSVLCHCFCCCCVVAAASAVAARVAAVAGVCLCCVAAGRRRCSCCCCSCCWWVLRVLERLFFVSCRFFFLKLSEYSTQLVVLSVHFSLCVSVCFQLVSRRTCALALTVILRVIDLWLKTHLKSAQDISHPVVRQDNVAIGIRHKPLLRSCQVHFARRVACM